MARVSANIRRTSTSVTNCSLGSCTTPSVPGETLAEHDVNGRLLPYSEDVAVLRRYLVDASLLERRVDGSQYALVERGPAPASE